MDGILSDRSKFTYNAIEEEDSLAQKLEKEGKKIIKLNRGDPPQYVKTPEYIIKAYIDALKKHETTYVDMTGIKELREAVSNRYSDKYKVNFTADDVVITQGVSEALAFINSSLINNKDKAILFKPYYPLYKPELQLYGGSPIIGSYSEEINWDIDIDSIKKQLKKLNKAQIGKIKYMMITNPNNPTGTVLDRKYLKEVVDLANEHDLFLISDEIYDEIIYNNAKFTSIGQISKGVPHMILNGASKVYDSTGFRIGFVIIPEKDKKSEIIRNKIKDYAVLRLSANTPAQFAIAEAINNKKEHEKAISSMVKTISDRVNYAYGLLKENEHLSVVKPNGSFYIFPKINKGSLKVKDDEDFINKLLIKKNVQVTAGSGFGEKDHFRIVSLPPKPVLKEAIDRINDFCYEMKK